MSKPLYQDNEWTRLRGVERQTQQVQNRTRGINQIVDDSDVAYEPRDTVQFPGATVTDDATNLKTVVTMPGASGGSQPWAHFRTFSGQSLAASGALTFNTTDATLFNTDDTAKFAFFPHASLGAGISLLVPGVFKATWEVNIVQNSMSTPGTKGIEVNPLTAGSAYLLIVENTRSEVYGYEWTPGSGAGRWRASITQLVGYDTFSSSNVLKVQAVNRSTQAFTSSVYGSLYIEYLGDETTQDFVNNWY